MDNQAILTAFSVLGSIASIIGAYWAFKEARKSKSFSELSKSIRNELISRRNLVESSTLLDETQKLINRLGKIGPSIDLKKLKGFDFKPLIEYITEYQTLLTKYGDQGNDDFKISSGAIYEDLKECVTQMNCSDGPETLRGIGTDIIYKVQIFLGKVQSLSNQHHDKALAKD